jgi:hypothetical protein
MINTSDEKSRAKAAKDTDARVKRRAEQAQIVAGLQSLLEPDEQLLGFTRGLIAGGLRGKLTVGFEALFAPYVNIGLTERRVVLQHVQPESGKPNEILPHSFPLSDMHSVAFSDVETFGGEPAGRLSLRLFNDQHFRLRFRGAALVDNAKTLADVFGSLTSTRPRARTSPTQSVCPHCDKILDRVSRFCPYCGQVLEPRTAIEPAEHAAMPGASASSPGWEAPPIEAETADPGTAAAEMNDTALTAGAPPDTDVAAAAPPESPESPEPPPSASDVEVNAGEPAAPEKPARKRAERPSAVETLAAESSPEPATEGHETPTRDNDPLENDTEGDRS